MSKIRFRLRSFVIFTSVVGSLTSGLSYAATPTSGILVVVNGLANLDAPGGIGLTATPIQVKVSDTSGQCGTLNNLAYHGVYTVSWSNSNLHTSSSCTNIATVTVTPLINPQVRDYVYGSTPITYTAPTAVYAEMVLIPVGRTTPAVNTPTATAWGTGTVAGVSPVFDANTAGLVTPGVPGIKHIIN